MAGRGIARFSLGAMLLLSACQGAADDSASSTEVRTEASDEPPAIAEGAVSGGSVEVDGTTIEYVTSVPQGFEIGLTAPVLLALPPGGQDLGLTRRLVESTYGPEARRLGWVVVSPAAPDGVLFFNGSERLLPGFLDWVETWVTPEGDVPHVTGASNGGISAFRYAAESPDRVGSVVAFPGFARSDADRAALADLRDVPLRLLVGAEDTSWADAAERTTDLAASVGGDVELIVFPGEGHIIDSTADGVLLFEHLESFR